MGSIAFASELKALVPLPEVSLELDVSALAQFLAVRYVPAPENPSSGYKKAPGGRDYFSFSRGCYRTQEILAVRNSNRQRGNPL